MTETQPTPVFPPDRYGRRREPGRRPGAVPALIAAVGVLLGLFFAVRLYTQYGRTSHRPAVIALEEFGDDHVTFRFRVETDGGASTCHVRARARDGAEVGAADVPVPAPAKGADTVTVRYRLATTRRPVSAEVTTCTAG